TYTGSGRADWPDEWREPVGGLAAPRDEPRHPTTPHLSGYRKSVVLSFDIISSLSEIPCIDNGLLYLLGGVMRETIDSGTTTIDY
ncbi:hypothetical protein J6590_020617, partial [Homalodisca vitripennis]